MPSHIAIVEDDRYLSQELESCFVNSAYQVSLIRDFNDPVAEIIALSPDLVVLDLNLPHTSGYDICKQLKAQTELPVLVLTARDTLADELNALGLGADDYLTKPCAAERLIARAERLLQTYAKIPQLAQAGDILFDLDSNKVTYGAGHLLLSQTEGMIFRLLVEAYPQAVSKQQLFAALWGGEQYVDINILQVNMVRLRKSLAALGLENCVQTVRGVGYRLRVGGE